MICSKCKRNINDNDRICPYCGQIVRYDDTNFDYSIAVKLKNEFLDYQERLKKIYENCSEIEKKYDFYFLTFLDGLKCQLRLYQEWGVKYTLHQKKVLIGDEMGLGKTIQAIATMTVLHNRGYSHFLVVCPASV